MSKERQMHFTGFHAAYGGGTGMSHFLWRVKRVFNRDKIVAVVTEADDGGNTGKLRKKNGSSAVGDIRQNLCPLAADNIQPEFTIISQWRIRGEYGDLNGKRMLDILEIGFNEAFENSHKANIAFKRIYGFTPEEIRSLNRYDYDLGAVGKLMAFHFPEKNGNNEMALKDNCVGNLILVGLERIFGGLEEGINIARLLYGVESYILPSTLDRNTELRVRLSNGQCVDGEHNIGKLLRTFGEGIAVRSVEAATPVDLNPLVIAATLQSKDRHWVWGSPVTSGAATSIPVGFKDVWKEVSIGKNGPTAIYGNIMTDDETRYMRKAWQQLEVIADGIGNRQAVSHVYLNDPRCIPPSAIERYAEYEQYPVEPTEDVVQKMFPNAVVKVLPLADYQEDTGHLRHSQTILEQAVLKDVA